MGIDLRAWINPQPYIGYSAEGIAREAAYFSPVPEPVTAEPEYVISEAREYELAGYDSATIPQSATWPDVAITATWALAHTESLRLALAHRPGIQGPAAAARALATLDRLSGGRTSVHLILGAGADSARDGDHADRAARYRRAEEYLEIFSHLLTDEQPLDFAGEFYDVRGAFSGPKPIQRPRPPISTPATSPEALELAVRRADVLAHAGLSRTEASREIDRARELAARPDIAAARAAAGLPELGFWNNLNLLVGETDEAARRHLAELEQAVSRLQAFRRRADAPLRSIREDRFADLQAAEDRWRDDVLYLGLTKLSRAAPILVGSPATVARAVLGYYELGVTVVSLGSHVTDQRDAVLRAETLRLIHAGVAAREEARSGRASSQAAV